MLRQQAETDRRWRDGQRAAPCGWRRSPTAASADGLEIPAFVFQPLEDAPAASRIRRSSGCTRTSAATCTNTTSRTSAKRRREGYVVIAPEYRGSIGYGKAFYDAIDYGGAEVDDVVTAASVVAIGYPQVDPLARRRS